MPQAKRPARRRKGDVEKAVQRDLDAIAVRDRELAHSTPAAVALRLARELDSPGNSATSASMCSRVLLDAYQVLAEAAPKPEVKGVVDKLAEKRAERLQGRRAG